MFMSVLLQLANCALERETRCDVASMLVTNTPKFSVIDCVPRSGLGWGRGDKKGKALGLKIHSFQFII